MPPAFIKRLQMGIMCGASSFGNVSIFQIMLLQRSLRSQGTELSMRERGLQAENGGSYRMVTETSEFNAWVYAAY